ncbi:DUF2256 domain-containing protein [Sphingobacterium sp.]|uniref:DUF2256 domain-containing protein n=1 Tax=Sphingobacterium sp. TaxID=341027 RepID=UPI0028A1DDBB|nr:DUF2256 domain-containing protein [Sphingobacterium sp.]
MKGVKKQNLPQKICATCGRSFTWRKKWEKNWEDVKYCSERCKKKRRHRNLYTYATTHLKTIPKVIY